MDNGKWIAFYVTLKLLGEGRLLKADDRLRKNYRRCLDILKVIREEFETNVLEYAIEGENVIIRKQETGETLAAIPASLFNKNADDLFKGIRDEKGSSIPAPDSVCDFARVIFVSKPKAPAVKALKQQFGGKNDIFVEVRDGQTALVSVMGFSIKSRFGHPATLFNAGASSRMRFRVEGCDDDIMAAFNAIGDGKNRDWAGCRAFLRENGLRLTYAGATDPTFENNLMLVQGTMGRILGMCMLDRLVEAKGGSGVMETTARLAAANPLSVPNPDIYYPKVMKDLLMASFSGMTAGTPWDGREQVSGGYIVVGENGEVLCCHSVDRESFRDYLFRNTMFEHVSADKYKWSYIAKADGGYFLPLNVSIRFRNGIR